MDLDRIAFLGMTLRSWLTLVLLAAAFLTVLGYSRTLTTNEGEVLAVTGLLLAALVTGIGAFPARYPTDQD